MSYNVAQCLTMSRNVLQHHMSYNVAQCLTMSRNVLQHACNVLQRRAMSYNVA